MDPDPDPETISKAKVKGLKIGPACEGNLGGNRVDAILDVEWHWLCDHPG